MVGHGVFAEGLNVKNLLLFFALKEASAPFWKITGQGHPYPERRHSYPVHRHINPGAGQMIAVARHPYPAGRDSYPDQRHSYPVGRDIYPPKGHLYPEEGHKYAVRGHLYPGERQLLGKFLYFSGFYVVFALAAAAAAVRGLAKWPFMEFT
jgi:hypothetical protein